jgi:hypothetical protein
MTHQNQIPSGYCIIITKDDDKILETVTNNPGITFDQLTTLYPQVPEDILIKRVRKLRKAWMLRTTGRGYMIRIYPPDPLVDQEHKRGPMRVIRMGQDD